MELAVSASAKATAERCGGPITSHVLDTALGRPASGVAVVLERLEGDVWQSVGRGVTNEDGRVAALCGETPPPAGVYRLTFDTGAYFARTDRDCFHPSVTVCFEVGPPQSAAAAHYHVPLLIAPYGYTTYRGS